MDWKQRDERGLLYDRIACALGAYNMVRERLIPLPFLRLLEIVENGIRWQKIIENCEIWDFALADRGLGIWIDFTRLRDRHRLYII